MSTIESTNPKDKIGKTKPPIHLIPASANIIESMAMSVGAKKYGPYNWREHSVSATVYVSAALRHLYQYLDGQDDDEESGVSHLGHLRACAGILIDAAANGMLVDDRPPKGTAAGLIEQYTVPRIPSLKEMADEVKMGVSLYDVDKDSHMDRAMRAAPGHINFGTGPTPGCKEPRPAFAPVGSVFKLLLTLGCKEDVASAIVRGIRTAPRGRDGAPYVYVAGPMRGKKDFNFPQFDAARDYFLSQGFNVISPADIDRAAGDSVGITEEQASARAKDYLYRDFYAIFLMMHTGVNGCNTVAFLPGWEKSTGAFAEFAIARWLGLKVVDATTGRVFSASEIAAVNVTGPVQNFLMSQLV